MEIDIDAFDVSELIFERLKEAFGDLKEVPSKMPAMDRMGEVRWYDPGEKARASFKSLRMQTIRDVEIKNFMTEKSLIFPIPLLPLSCLIIRFPFLSMLLMLIYTKESMCM